MRTQLIAHHRPHRVIAVTGMALALVCALLIGARPAEAASADYIVVLKPGVSLQGHLRAMRITPNRLYTSAATGYEAGLNDTQYKRVLASPDTTIVTPNSVVATLIPMAKPPPPLSRPSL